MPSENLVYADVDGNIGWVAAGIAPVRKGWSGLLPVPGAEHPGVRGRVPVLQLLGVDPDAYGLRLTGAQMHLLVAAERAVAEQQRAVEIEHEAVDGRQWLELRLLGRVSTHEGSPFIARA